MPPHTLQAHLYMLHSPLWIRSVADPDVPAQVRLSRIVPAALRALVPLLEMDGLEVVR